MGELTENFKAQASKTSIESSRRKSNMSCRGLSTNRNKPYYCKEEHSKSSNRVGKKAASRQKSVANETHTRNNTNTFNSYDPKTVTKRVGGGYSSFYVPNEFEESHNVNENNDRNKVRHAASSKRKSWEELNRGDLHKIQAKETAQKLLSPWTKQPRLIRKKSEQESLNNSNFNSFSLMKKVQSSTYKIFKHKSDCKKWNECDQCNWVPVHSSNKDKSVGCLIQEERCSKCKKALVNSKRSVSKVKDKSLAQSQLNDNGKLRLEDLNTEPQPMVPNQKPWNTTKTIRNSQSKLQLAYDKSMSEIENLKSEKRALTQQNKDLGEKLSHSKSMIESVVLTSINLYTQAYESQICNNLSIKNYFGFMEIFKNMQDWAINEDDISVIRDKFEDFSHPVFQFNFEEMQQKIDATKKSLGDIKQDLVEMVPKLDKLKVSSNIISRLTQISNEVTEVEETSFNPADLDDLLFSTQRKSIARESICDGFLTSKEGFASNFDINQDQMQEEMKQTIKGLTKELQVCKEQNEQQVDLNSKYQQDLKSLQHKYIKLEEKLAKAKQIISNNKCKWLR